MTASIIVSDMLVYGMYAGLGAVVFMLLKLNVVLYRLGMAERAAKRRSRAHEWAEQANAPWKPDYIIKEDEWPPLVTPITRRPIVR